MLFFPFMKLYLSFVLVLFFSASHQIFAQKDSPLYQSDNLIIKQISPNTYLHISYLTTQDFGKVQCNGMILIQDNEALVVDAPTEDAASEELIAWLMEQEANATAVLSTHFHNDCVGGLKAFHEVGVPSYASFQTIKLAQEAGEPVPQKGFDGELSLKVGELEVITRFLGEGHTRDNVVTYVPSEQILFGGCLIKSIGSGEGFLGDANTEAWSETVRKVKSAFADVKTVIPGHGGIGDAELLDYTIRLFEKK
jgi:metallo-beta-lactamase class B